MQLPLSQKQLSLSLSPSLSYFPASLYALAPMLMGSPFGKEIKSEVASRVGVREGRINRQWLLLVLC